MSILEIKLVMIFFYTKHIDGVNAGLRSLDALERRAVTIEESDTIKDMANFLEIRGINNESI